MQQSHGSRTLKEDWAHGKANTKHGTTDEEMEVGECRGTKRSDRLGSSGSPNRSGRDGQATAITRVSPGWMRGACSADRWPTTRERRAVGPREPQSAAHSDQKGALSLSSLPSPKFWSRVEGVGAGGGGDFPFSRGRDNYICMKYEQMFSLCAVERQMLHCLFLSAAVWL